MLIFVQGFKTSEAYTAKKNYHCDVTILVVNLLTSGNLGGQKSHAEAFVYLARISIHTLTSCLGKANKSPVFMLAYNMSPL
jgi:hypothetical protein